MSVSRGSFSIQGSNLFLLQWQADFLPLSHLGSAELMFLQTTRVLWRRKECQGSLHHRIPKPTEKSQALGISLPNHAGLPSFLWCSCPPVWSMEDWRQARPEPQSSWVQSPWPCTPWLTPLHSLTCSIPPKSSWGDGGPHPALLPLHFSHINPGQEEEVPTFIIRLSHMLPGGILKTLPKVEEVS